MSNRLRFLLSPLVGSLLLTLAAAPVAAQRAPAAPQACTDFYGYTNAAWLAQNPLPATQDHFSRWDQLNALGLVQRDQVLASTTAPAGATVSMRLADLFASAEDEAAIAALHAAGLPVLVDLQVLRDNRGNPYAQVGPAGMGLPDPGFYGSADPLVQPVEQKYTAAVSEWLRLTGTPANKLAEQTGQVL